LTGIYPTATKVAIVLASSMGDRSSRARFSMSEFERRGIVKVVLDESGDRRDAGEPGGAPTSLPCNEFISAGRARAHYDWLQDAALAYRIGERGQR
jgi:hypothetical protein